MRIRGSRVIVVGAGGSARAVLAALTDAGAVSIRIANRTRRRAVRLARIFATAGTSIEAIGLDELARPDRVRGVRLVVNTTSLGLHGEAFPAVAARETAADCLFFDLVYGRKTSFATTAVRTKRNACDGREMLLHQGAEAFRLWTGRPAPLAAMRQVLESP